MSAINLLLVGRTGNGKSSTGNSILGKKIFTPRGSSLPATYNIKKADASLDGITVTVVDGPGVGDSETDKTVDGQSMLELVRQTLSLISYRFHALLFVLKYGVRFTKQEKDAVIMIRTIFGEDVLKNYVIIVLTYGDSFDLDTEDDKISFEIWCKEQTGDFQALLTECNNRCVLFNNMSKDPLKIKEQRQELLNVVTDITKNREPYNADDFENAKHGQYRLTVMTKLPELEEKTEQVLQQINEALEYFERNKNHDHEKHIMSLEKLSYELLAHVNFLENEDQGSKAVNHLITKISIMQLKIKNMTVFHKLKLQQKKDQPDYYYYLQKLWNHFKSYYKPYLVIGIVVAAYLFKKTFQPPPPPPPPEPIDSSKYMKWINGKLCFRH